MPMMGKALRERLRADPAVGAVCARFFWGGAPRGTPLPYVVLQTISEVGAGHLEPGASARQSRVQVDCYAARWGDAREIAHAIEDCMEKPATRGGVAFGLCAVDGPRDLGVPMGDEFLHRASLDLGCWWSKV